MKLDFEKLKNVVGCGESVIPVVVQHADTKAVLILAYSNQVALEESLRTGYAVFWSTSRNELWEKGKTSGNRLALVSVRVNCEDNSLLYLVKPLGEGVCHTKDTLGKYRDTCYYREYVDFKFREISVSDAEIS